MIASWGLLAFLKAADTRQNASFAIRLDKKGEFEQELEGGSLEDPDELYRSIPKASKIRKPSSKRRFENTTVVKKSRKADRKQTDLPGSPNVHGHRNHCRIIIMTRR